MSNKKLSKMAFPVIMFIIFVYFFKFMSNTNKSNIYVLPEVNQKMIVQAAGSEMINQAQRCYIDKFIPWKNIQTKWFEFGDIFEVSKFFLMFIKMFFKSCSKNIINYIPYMETTAGTVERKYYMMPKMPYINNTCSIVTFG